MALTATALCILGAGTARPAAPNALAAGPATSALSAPPLRDETMRAAGCPAATLPDGDGVCVHLPIGGEGGPAIASAVNAHRDRRGQWVVYDQIPRRPDRPANYDAYRLPVPCEPSCAIVSGYDLDRPDEFQRRGSRLRYVGHGAIDIAAPRGTPVATMALEHQQGPAQVVFVGWLFGNTVVTRHVLLEGGERRDYLVILGHLDAASPTLVPGADLPEGEVLGLVGDSGSKGLVHLHFEVRRWRPGPAPMSLAVAASQPGTLIGEAQSIVCDPRNVLPLR